MFASRIALPACAAFASLCLTLSPLLPSSAVASSPDPAATPTARSSGEVRFGAVESYTAPVRAREAGVTWERVIFRWDQYQPKSPTDWESNKIFSDSDLAMELAEGRKVVGVVLGTPTWLGAIDPNAAPINLDLPYNDPKNYWGQFMQRLAAQYKGRVDEWIIWNEPDIWNNDSGIQQWNGSCEQYYRLVKVAYQSIKSVNPEGRVALAGLTYWWDQQFGREQYLSRFLKIANADPTARANGYYFDAASLHLYGNPQDLYDVPRLWKKIMREYDIEKPIWITETNVVPYDDSGVRLGRDSFRASMDEQAAYLVQAFASGLAAGVDRISVYKMQDDIGRLGAEPYGLVRSDAGASPRASYQSYQAITRYMSGARSARVYQQGSVRMVKIERDGDWVTVLWNTVPGSIQIPLPARTSVAVLVDRFAHTQVVSARDGKYFIDLTGATANTVPGAPNVYHIGGNPLILVEDKKLSTGGGVAGQDWSQPGVNPNSKWVSHVTGYSVSGDWLAYYRSLGGDTTLGHPLGNVRLDPADGKTVVQYFERAVLEWHPENPAQSRVQRRLLGNTLYPNAYEAAVDPQDAKKRPKGDPTYFPDKPGQGLGHYVADYAPDGSATRFKEYFTSHGGVNTFGFPKEEPRLRNGLWTQRFQAAVFEYRPETGTVKLQQLGEQALSELTLPGDW